MFNKAIMILLLPLLLISLSAFASPPKGLVLYLPFDGNVDDASGNGNQTTIIGDPKWVDGKFGKAMEFNGATYIEVPDEVDGTFDGVSGLTLEVWVRQYTHHNNGIVVKLITPGQHWPCSYNLETWEDQLAYFAANTDTGEWATGAYPLDKWFHFAGVFDNGEERIYINGELIASVSDPSKTITDGDMPVYIGCVEPGAYPFTGELDELAIYNRALTTAEIQADMNSGIYMTVESLGKLATTWAMIKTPR